MKDLKGKKILVTGGAKGIGAGIAQAFEKQGCKVFVCGRSTAAAGFEMYYTDLSDLTRTEKMFDKIGAIDILVNNAGTSLNKTFIDMTEEEIDLCIANNLKSTVNASRCALKKMCSLNERGAVINISSVWGISGGANEALYSAVKAGIIGLTKALAKEYASVATVNCIAPGAIEDTDMMSEYGAEAVSNIKKETPLGRLGKISDIEEAAVYLAQADFVTGQVLTVDGGLIL